MNNVVSFQSRKEEKLEESRLTSSYFGKNSIVMGNEALPDLEICVVLDVDEEGTPDEEKVTLNDLLPTEQLLVNIIVINPDSTGSCSDEDIAIERLMFRPRYGDILNLVIEYLFSIGEFSAMGFIYDVYEDPDWENLFIVQFHVMEE